MVLIVIIYFTIQVKAYLSYCPVAIPTESEFEPCENASYTKAQFTSSSDEDCDHSLKTNKIHAKRLLFSKPSTSSLESRPEIIDINETSSICIDRDDVFDEPSEANENRTLVNTEKNSPEVDKNEGEMDVDGKYTQNDIIATKISDEDSVKKTQKKRRRKQNKRNISIPIEVDNDKELVKYWIKRYRLFSKFDQGIKLDRGEFPSKVNVIYVISSYGLEYTILFFSQRVGFL